MRTLAEVQQVELRMLRALDEIAEAHGLSYFLGYGTALGAVRDGRQIPWDWDMDVLVPLADYDALTKALREELPRDLCLSDGSTVEGYGPLFSRISHAELDHSIIHLDLFPLVGTTSNRRWQKLLVHMNHVLSRIHMLKSLRISDRPHYSLKKRLVAVAVRVGMAPVPQSAIRRLFRRINFSRPDGASTLFSPLGPYGMREFFPADWFASSRPCTLSGVSTRLPVGVDQLLRLQYGESYLTPIPESRQQQEYDFFESFLLPRIQSGLNLGN